MLKYIVSNDMNCIMEVEYTEVANEHGLLTKSTTPTKNYWIIDNSDFEDDNDSLYKLYITEIMSDISFDENTRVGFDTFIKAKDYIIDEKENQIALLEEDITLVNTFRPSLQNQLEETFEEIDSKHSRNTNCKTLTKIVTCVLSMNFNEAPNEILAVKDKEKPEDEGICVGWYIGDYEIFVSCFNSENILGLILSSNHSNNFSFKTNSIEELLQKHIELTKGK